MAYEVTFIPGGGTGPGLAEATRRVLEATGVEFEWDVQQAGIDEYERTGNPLAKAIAEVLRTGEKVTSDLKPHRDDPTAVGTSEFADAVIQEMKP